MYSEEGAISINIPDVYFALDKPFLPVMYQLLKQTTDLLENTLKNVIQDQNFIASGELLSSIYARVDNAGSLGQFSASVGSAVAYASVAEYGREAGFGMPSYEAIEKWMDFKGIAPDNPKEKARMAFLIARAIGRRGMTARHIFSIARDRAEPAIQALWEAGLNQFIESFNRGQ